MSSSHFVPRMVPLEPPIDDCQVQMHLVRNQNTSKHDYGHALLVAGAHGRMGCSILAARAALRSGCGLVSVHLPGRCVDPMQVAFPEAMVSIDSCDTYFATLPDHLERYSAIAAGPGIGTHPDTARALLQLLEKRPSGVPIILDADALNVLASLPKEKLSTFNFQLSIFTPHAGEYRRLFGDADPVEMSDRYGCIIVNKSHNTHVYAPGGKLYVNHTGNAGMATAGSGDVLTGILLGMAATWYAGVQSVANRPLHSLFDIVCKAVEIHGKIGDIAVQKQSESSLVASDMVENLRTVSVDITGC